MSKALIASTLVIVSVAAFVVVFELLLPLLIVGRDPERVLELLLPSFNPSRELLSPLTRWIARSVASTAAASPQPAADEAAEEASEAGQGVSRTRPSRKD